MPATPSSPKGLDSAKFRHAAVTGAARRRGAFMPHMRHVEARPLVASDPIRAAADVLESLAAAGHAGARRRCAPPRRIRQISAPGSRRSPATASVAPGARLSSGLPSPIRGRGPANLALRTIVPLAVGTMLYVMPAPAGLTASAWSYFALFSTVIAGLITEPLPGPVIGLLGITVAALARLVAPTPDEAARWALGGFAHGTVWLIFVAFMFGLGYEKTGLGRRIALTLVRALGGRTLGLGYAVALADLVLAPFTPSNTARSGGMIFPIIKTIPAMYESYPRAGARRMGAFLMWTAFAATGVTSSMFLTANAANLLAHPGRAAPLPRALALLRHRPHGSAHALRDGTGAHLLRERIHHATGVLGPGRPVRRRVPGRPADPGRDVAPRPRLTKRHSGVVHPPARRLGISIARSRLWHDTMGDTTGRITVGSRRKARHGDSRHRSAVREPS